MRRGLLAVLLLSVIIPSTPRLIEQVRLAVHLLPMSWEARREAIMPGFYSNVERLRRQLSPRESLAAIATSPAESDQTVFLNYYLFPRRVRSYANRFAYLADTSGRPNLIVRPADARLTTYAEVRDHDLRRSRVVRDLTVPAEARSRFLIPIVSSSDGMPAATYTVEGVLASGGPAQVRLTLWPAGIVRMMTVDGRRTFYDLVYETFGRMEFVGWVEADSDRPLHPAFWFANRIAGTATPIRLADGALRSAVAFPSLPAPTLLWLVNPSGNPVVAHAGSHPALVLPHDLIGIRATGTVTGPVYAFLSEKLPNGGTRFTWPEDVR